MDCMCGQKAKRANIEFRLYGLAIGKYPGFKCTSCGEEWFDEGTVSEIEAKTRKLGLFGLEKEEKIAVAGNSLMVRIPKPIAEFMKIKKGSLVRVEPHGREKLVVEIRK